MSALWSIFIGVMAGVMTSVFLWVLSKIFTLLVQPWYEGVVYKGVRVHGRWLGYYRRRQDDVPLVGDPDFTVEMHQSGQKVSGVIVRSKLKGGERDVKVFSFTGLFRDGRLLVTYEPQDKTRLGFGSRLYKLVSDGTRLEGKTLFVGSYDCEIKTDYETWVKDT